MFESFACRCMWWCLTNSVLFVFPYAVCIVGHRSDLFLQICQSGTLLEMITLEIYLRIPYLGISLTCSEVETGRDLTVVSECCFLIDICSSPHSLYNRLTKKIFNCDFSIASNFNSVNWSFEVRAILSSIDKECVFLTIITCDLNSCK